MRNEATMRNWSMGEYLLRRYRERQPLLPLGAENVDELRQWQAQFRAKVWEGLGILPEQKCPLEPLTVDRTDMGDHWREKVLFQSERA